jgi:hypothetical protein
MSIFFLKKLTILKAKMRFCQTLNCIIKNHVFKWYILESAFLNHTF